MHIAVSALAYVAMLLYLFVQSKSDAKSGMVLKFYNDAALSLSFISYTIFLAINKLNILEEMKISFMICIALFLISADFVPKSLKVMQKADAKAFASIYFSSFLIFGCQFSLVILLFSMFVANVLFLFWHHVLIRRKLKLVGNERFPYFPFILLGYLICTSVLICKLIM